MGGTFADWGRGPRAICCGDGSGGPGREEPALTRRRAGTAFGLRGAANSRWPRAGTGGLPMVSPRSDLRVASLARLAGLVAVLTLVLGVVQTRSAAAEMSDYRVTDTTAIYHGNCRL